MSSATPKLIIQSSEKSHAVKRLRGEAGSLQTLAVMAEAVRRSVGMENDRRYNVDLGLRDFALEIVEGVRGHQDVELVDTLFYYTRDRIKYRKDPYGFEKIQDSRRTIASGIGDCGDKTVLLAVLASLLGYQSRFIVLSYKPPAFQHVYIEVNVKGKWRIYDPTPEEAIPGWEDKAMRRMHYPIFDKGDVNDPNNLAGFMDFLKAGLSVIPVVGGAAAAAVGAGQAHVAGRKAEEAARDELREQAYSALADLLAGTRGGSVDPQVAARHAKEIVDSYYRSIAGFKTASVKTSAENFRSYFNERIAEVTAAAETAKQYQQATAQSGQSLQATAGTNGGIDQKTLMIGGAAVVGLLLLTR